MRASSDTRFPLTRSYIYQDDLRQAAKMTSVRHTVFIFEKMFLVENSAPRGTYENVHHTCSTPSAWCVVCTLQHPAGFGSDGPEDSRFTRADKRGSHAQ
jgi:hypothetical protein